MVWLMHEEEIEAVHAYLNNVVTAAQARGEPVEPLVEQELALLGRLQAAPQRLTEQIHLFPSAGVTPGAASLLALQHDRTIAVVGDAILAPFPATRDRSRLGPVWWSR